MTYLLYKLGIWLANTLPLKISHKIAEAFGSLYYLSARKDRKIVTENMKVVLGYPSDNKKIKDTSRMVFVNFAHYLLEFFRTDKVDSRFIEESVSIEGQEHLDEAFKLGKGVILVSAHLGNWELGGTIVAMLGYKVSVVAWMHKNKKVNEFFLSQRKNKGIGIISLSAAKRGVLSVLEKNEAVGFIGDINFTHPNRGLKVKLFNQETTMPKGPAAFSLKTGAPILTMFTIRQNDHTFRIIFEKLIISTTRLRNNSEMLTLTKQITKRIENMVAQYPQQWFMLTPRWRPVSN